LSYWNVATFFPFRDAASEKRGENAQFAESTFGWVGNGPSFLRWLCQKSVMQKGSLITLLG
jgi:hypothetical protein